MAAKKRVLLVDYDVEPRQDLLALLEEGGYTVETARGEMSLYRLTRRLEKFSAALLAIGVDKTCFETVQVLHAEKADLPILLVIDEQPLQRQVPNIQKMYSA